MCQLLGWWSSGGWGGGVLQGGGGEGEGGVVQGVWSLDGAWGCVGVIFWLGSLF